MLEPLPDDIPKYLKFPKGPDKIRCWSYTVGEGMENIYSICYAPCQRFNPDNPEECPVLSGARLMEAEHGVKIPIWECPLFIPPEGDPAYPVADRVVGGTRRYVYEALIDLQENYSLCHDPCQLFKPEDPPNQCPIVLAAQELAGTNKVEIPIWECFNFIPPAPPA